MTRHSLSETRRANRRRFLGTAAGTLAAGAFGVPLFVRRSALAAPGRPGANDRISIGAIGVGRRASLLLRQLPPSAQVVAMADCNLPVPRPA